MKRNGVLLVGVALALAAISCTAAPPSAKEDEARMEQALRVAEYLARGDAHWRGRRFQEALDSYLEAGKISPDDPRVLFSIGSAHRELGNLREALRNFTRALEVASGDPRNGRVHGQIGYIHWRANNYATAIDAYQSALKLDPNNWRTLWYLADLHYKTKQYDLTKQYVAKFRHFTATYDPTLVSEQERADIRKFSNQLEDLLRRIEQGDVPR